ncbi:GGDEF domain-containing protein [bacterium]|nr:GGDEF domain-containing protein [bacterium]
MDLRVTLALLAGAQFLAIIGLAAYRGKHGDRAMFDHLIAQLIALASTIAFLKGVIFSLAPLVVAGGMLLLAWLHVESLALLGLAGLLGQKHKEQSRVVALAGMVFYGLASAIVNSAAFGAAILASAATVVIAIPAFLILRNPGRSLLDSWLCALLAAFAASFIARAAGALGAGAAFVPFGPGAGEELFAAGLLLFFVGEGIAVLLAAKEKIDLRILNLAHTDAMTGVLNRSGFIDGMASATGKASYDNEAFSMLLVEIDGLGAINEARGYEAGDAVILSSVRTLESIMDKKGFVGRVSGDEFAAYAAGMDSRRLRSLVLQLRSALRGVDAGMEYSSTIGAIAIDSPTGKDLRYETLYAACSDSLKAAKRKGLFEAVVGIA